jgi:hypothetical protein
VCLLPCFDTRISKHNRRDEYWKYYHLAHTQERDFLVNQMVNEKSSPDSTRARVESPKPRYTASV